MRRPLLLCLLLAGITLAIYGPVGGFDLIYYDDPLLLTDCPAVQAGLTWASLKWAGTSVVIANWHPVTNLSFLLVSEFFGVAPGPQHLANALIHAANAALLFLLLRRLTGATWRSAAVAALFAWHPLRVESVAWIAERKDGLCAFFFLLALLSYAGYVKLAKGQRPQAKVRYAGALGFFALALLSKPMAVTLPFLMLWLDIWPLQRFGPLPAGGRRRAAAVRTGQLALEKWPFFVLALVFCVITLRIQHDFAAMALTDQIGWGARGANALASYVAYLEKLFWPVNLAVIYPFPPSYDPATAVAQAGLLAAISIGCGWQWRRRPWLAMGWGWYLGTALPIIGLVQVGGQAMADRYTYLPLIGPAVALVWTAAEIGLRRGRGGKIFLGATAAVVGGTLMLLTGRQLQLWRNTVSLFEHTVAVTADNPSAQFCLGVGLEHENRLEEAMAHFRLQAQLCPEDYRPHYGLARVLGKLGRWEEARAEDEIAAAANPGDPICHLNLAECLTQLGRGEEARRELNEALRIKPDSSEALNNLAWLLATSTNAALRNGPQAVDLARHACELTGDKKALYLGTLAAAYAEAGNYADAVTTARRASERAAQNCETNLVLRNQQLLELYQRHQPVRE